MRYLYSLCLLLFCLIHPLLVMAQASLSQNQPKTWPELIKEPVVRFTDVQAAYERAFAENPKGEYDHYYKWVARVLPYLDANGIYDAGREQALLLAARQQRDKAAAAKATVANWQLLGPIGPPAPTNWNNYSVGRIDAIAFHPTDANTFYAGSPTGGLWKTTNGGASWIFLSQAWPSLGVSDIVLDPTNPNIIYVATGDRDSGATLAFGIQKSTDGGSTWTTLPTPSTNASRQSRLLVHPTTPSTVLLATNTGVFRSTNGGSSWVQATGLSTSNNVQDIEFKPGDPNTVYAVTNGKFFKSLDGGSSFVEVMGTVINGTNSQRMSVAVTPAAPNQVIVSNATGTLEGIYRSSDSGSSFTKITSATSSVSTSTGSGPITNYISQTWYTWTLAVSPTNADEIWLGTISMIKTTNGGTNWQSVDGNVHVDIHAFEFQPGTNRLFVGSDGGINRSPLSGTGNFDILHNGMSISQIYRIGGVANAAGPVYMGLQDNGIVRYNGGTHTIQMIGDGMESVIDPTNPQVIYACRQNGNINKTVNGGGNWVGITPNPAPAGSSWTIPLVMNPANPQVLLAGYGQVYKSVNGGGSWTQLGVMGGAGSILSLAYAPSNPAVIYASRGGSLYNTTDGGNTWLQLTLPISNYFINALAVSSTNAARLWVCVRDYSLGKSRVMTSGNGGTNWTDYSGTLPNAVLRAIVTQTNSNDAIYLGTDVGVFYRDASMTDWVVFNTGMPNVQVNDLEISYANGGKIRAATYGRGLWESDLYANGLMGTPAIALGNINSSYCSGQTFSLPYSTTGVFGSTNQFQVQLSDASGVFAASPTVIGTGTVSPINCTLAAGLPSGTGYRVRVVGTDPSLVSNTSNAFLLIATISPPVLASQTVATPAYSATLTATGCTGGVVNWFTNIQTGNSVYSGSLFVPTIQTTAVVYYAECSIGSCTSPTRSSVTVLGDPRNCRPTYGYGCADYDGLQTFQVNNVLLSNNSGCSVGGYGQFTTNTTVLQPSISYPFALTLLSASYQEGVTIWADLNRNAIYESSERLFQTSSLVTGSLSGMLALPGSTTAGALPLRVMVAYNFIPNDPCGVYDYGETEDYVLTVGSSGTSCISATATLTGSQTITSGQTATLTATLTGSSPYSLTMSNGQTFSSITTSPFAITVAPTATTIYSVVAVSNGCGTTTGSGSALVTVINTNTCAAPTSLTESEMTPTSIRLNWLAVSGATSYTLQYRETGTTAWTTASPGATSIGWTIAALLGKTYEWQIRTACTGGQVSQWSALRTFTMVCPIPFGQSEVVGTNVATLAWRYMSVNNISLNYNLQWRPVGSNVWTTIPTVSASSYQLTGLINGQVYEWQLQTICPDGSTTPYIQPRSFTTGCFAPGTLSDQNRTATSTQIIWQGLPGVTSSLRFRTVGSTSWNTVTGLTGNVYSLTGLTNATTYEVQVQSVCSASQTSAFTASYTFTTSCTPPITGAGTVSTNSALLTWINLGVGVRYNLVWRQVGSPVSFTVTSLTASSYSLTGLTNATTYEFQVQTICTDGTLSNYSDNRSFTTSCNAPPGFSSSLGATFINSSWTDFGPRVRYNLQWRPVGAAGWTMVSALTTAAYNLTGLSPLTTYEFIVQTICPDGSTSAYTTPRLGTTTSCQTPTNPTESSLLATSVRLNWGWYSNTSLRLQWRTVGASTWNTVSGITAGFYNLTGLTASTAYEWQVQSDCSPTVSSALTAPRTFTTLPPCTLMYTLQNGSWSDPTVWSCNRIPTTTDLVELRHLITIPSSITVAARQVRYTTGGKLIYGTSSKLILGF